MAFCIFALGIKFKGSLTIIKCLKGTERRKRTIFQIPSFIHESDDISFTKEMVAHVIVIFSTNQVCSALEYMLLLTVWSSICTYEIALEQNASTSFDLMRSLKAP
ncbi:unnamed protein product [Albugo candida]|uniref:Uncharacterized protein n=1 Tax=Albugo candida TaxID=65357 RepID=A0A024GDV9_9STRA|nr:unnamed protein product [Albugo candida]|eukprot:CCI44869.1 unnamed protein product [Albugo candida]